jgi:hypothetical protein
VTRIRRAAPNRGPESPRHAELARARAAAAAEASGPPEEVGRWDLSATATLPIVAIHAALLPTGEVMIFSYPDAPRENSAQAWLWDPATNELTRRDPPLWQDPKDGQHKAAKHLVLGAHVHRRRGARRLRRQPRLRGRGLHVEGLDKVYTFDPFAKTWREQPDMAHGRSMEQVGGGVGRDSTAPSPQHASTPDQLQIELWDPATGEWRLGPPQTEAPRQRCGSLSSAGCPDARRASLECRLR